MKTWQPFPSPSPLSPLCKPCKGVRELRGSKDSMAWVEELFKAMHAKLTPNSSLTVASVASPRSEQEHKLDSDSSQVKGIWVPAGTTGCKSPNRSLNNARSFLKSPTQCELQAMLVWSSIPAHWSISYTEGWGPCEPGPLSREDGLWQHQGLLQTACPNSICLQPSPLLPCWIYSGCADLSFNNSR